VSGPESTSLAPHQRMASFKRRRRPDSVYDRLTFRAFYSIIDRPIQSLLSQRTAKSGGLSPCKKAS
jgi:hypothetical protein